MASIDRGVPWTAAIAFLFLLAGQAAGRIPSAAPATTQTKERAVAPQKLKSPTNTREASAQTALSGKTSLSPDVSAIRNLLKTPDQQSALKLVQLIEQPDPKNATEICSGLGERGDSIFVPVALHGLERQSDAGAQESCARAVAKLNAPDGFEGLNRVALSDQQPVTARLAAIKALARAATDQAPALVPLLNNSDPRIRAAAAYSACQLRVLQAVPGVAALAVDPDPQVRQAALDAISLWPEAFSKQLLAIASNPKESEDNRVLGLTALDAFPAEQKTAALVKSVSSLLDVQQPRDVQIASVQLLSQLPEARPALAQFSQKPGISREVLAHMEDAGIQPWYTAAKEASAPAREVHGDYSAAWIALLGAIVGGLLSVGGNFLLEWFKQRAKKKRDEPRKEILRKMLRDERFPERWRKLRTLMHVIGADEATTKRLLIEIGARGSEDGEDLWGLIEDHPFGKKD